MSNIFAPLNHSTQILKPVDIENNRLAWEGRQLLTYEPTRSAYSKGGVGFKEISEWYFQRKEKLVPCNKCPRDLFTKRYFEPENDKFSTSGKMV